MKNGVIKYGMLAFSAFGLVILANFQVDQAARLVAEERHNMSSAKTVNSFTVENFSGNQLLLARNFAERMPETLPTMANIAEKKDLFINTLLPIILAENEKINDLRVRLVDLKNQQPTFATIAEDDIDWLITLAEDIELTSSEPEITGLIDELLFHYDIIPPSLVTAQAIIESGWGTSRFAQEGNALFGMWIWGKGGGMVPEARQDGKTHRIKSYDSISGSVSDYIHNLNYHRSYTLLRTIRRDLREAGKPLSGEALAEGLINYSEKGAEYVSSVRAIITYNGLNALDTAKLEASNE